ncbi:DNA primase [Arundinibacter roseus]|uniref:DNA primase n=1 Tax=Arundinibacter roseus TaxID=2070510 RepID=A0A4R4K7W3_9BACT|nr:DNA primase [Arundinibacter roseus]TDB63620.1 DNA primase [Arundinibacter roseus]
MRINPETVERIKHAADIVEVVGDYVALKKRGANYTACCPFHNEKTPSFNVNPARQIYKCFGCGAAGDPVKFVMDIDGIGYGEALRYLAQKYSIEIQEERLTDEQEQRQNERESLFIVLNFAKNFFEDQLLTTEEGQSIGLSYFRERGFNDTTRKKFELGYSPEAWDALAQAALAKGYSAEILEKAGLFIPREGSATGGYDRFRSRVIFPIHSVAGKVIAFGARIMKTDSAAKGHQPKYLNSPETAVYHKSEVLYGIFQAKNAIRQADVCYLVEGYTDVVSLHQAGIENVVASSGTSLTVEQIRLIGRFTPNVTILYDGDAAGLKAALRGLDLVLEEGLNVSIVTFPPGEDPDSYVRLIGTEAFKDYLRKSARDFITFKTTTLLADAGEDPFRKAAVIGEVVGSIVRIPDAIQRQIFFHKIAEMMRVDEQMLISEGNKLLRKQKETRPNTQSGKNEKSELNGPNDVAVGEVENRQEPVLAPTVKVLQRDPVVQHEQECIRLLINFASFELEPTVSLCHYMLSELTGVEFRQPLYKHVLTVFRESFSRGEIPETDYFVNHPDPDIRSEAIDLVTTRHLLSDQWKDKYEIFVPTELDKLHDLAFTNILRLKKGYNELAMQEIREQLQKTKDEAETNLLLHQFMTHKNIEKEIANLLGSVIS